MIRLPHQFHKSASLVRLSLSYLAIITVLSVGFSAAFYASSTSTSLNVQILQTTTAHPTRGTPQTAQGQSAKRDVKTKAASDQSTPRVTAVSDVAAIDAEVKKRLLVFQAALKRELVIFNLGILVAGSIFSYFLAKRTLRPIEASADAQARFASDASHEFRTPLTIMQTELDVVLTEPKLTLARAKEALISNRQEVARLKQLCGGLLRLAKTANRPDVMAVVSLDETANQAINQLLKQAQAKHITISDNIPRLQVQGDGQGLVQAFVILLDNAIKYSSEGTTIDVAGHIHGRHVLLNVHDQGPGIAARDIPHIFERFYRADSSRTRQGVEGYGLGLSIAHQIIRQHGGKLSVTSKLGEGSTFTVQLPAKKM